MPSQLCVFTRTYETKRGMNFVQLELLSHWTAWPTNMTFIIRLVMQHLFFNYIWNRHNNALLALVHLWELERLYFCRVLIYKFIYLYHNLFMEIFSCTFFIIKKSFPFFFAMLLQTYIQIISYATKQLMWIVWFQLKRWMAKGLKQRRLKFLPQLFRVFKLLLTIPHFWFTHYLSFSCIIHEVDLQLHVNRDGADVGILWQGQTAFSAWAAISNSI